MKVAIVNQPWNHAPPATGGSIAIWTWEVARRLVSLPAIDEVYVYARRNPGQPAYEEIEGVRCVRFPVLNDLRILKAFRILSRRFGIFRFPFRSRWFYRLYMSAVAKDIHARNVNLVHLHNISQHVPVIRNKNREARIVLHMHCEWLTQLKRADIARRIDQTDAVFGCSSYIIDKIRERFPEFSQKCCVVYNGVDVDKFSPSVTGPDGKQGGDKESGRLLFVGRVTPEKSIHRLIEAVEIVAESRPGIRLDIVGPDAETPREYIVDLSDDPRVKSLNSWYDGNYYQRLKKKAGEGENSRVRFVGLVHPDNLVDYYRGADLLVNPSVSESFGMSLVEAMSCGVPVLATKVGGMPEIVDPGVTGALVEPDDAEVLARAILGQLDSSTNREQSGSACRNRAVDLFSWDRVAESVARAYSDCNNN